MASNKCAICTETVRKNTAVTCAKCSNGSCRPCFQTYLLNSPLAATCMHCREPLNDDFVIDNTTASWRLSTYKRYKEDVMLDIEKARLPETQQYAIAYKNASEMVIVLRKAHSDVYKMKCKNEAEVAERTRLIIENGNMIHRYYEVVNTWGRRAFDETETRPVAASFIKACPSSNCRGFLGEDFVCGLCNVAVCKTCHEAVDPTLAHVCNPDTVASVIALAKETRPCPSCSAVISKIDGCDQMWCTQCQTTFSWRTGLKETGRVHNPHYYEYMRQRGTLQREPGDPGGACNAVPTYAEMWRVFSNRARGGYSRLYGGWEKYMIYRRNVLLARGNETDDVAIERLKKYKGDNYVVPPMPEGATKPPEFQYEPTKEKYYLANLYVFHQKVAHRARGFVQGVAPDNHDLRVKLLLGKITEMQMKVEIQMRAKHYQKELAVQQINDMVTNASNDLLRNYYQELKADTNVWEIVKDADGVKPYWINMEGQKSDTIKTPRIYDVHQPIHAKFNTEMLSLIEYVNKCYTRIEKAFNNKIERINLYY